MTPASHVLEIYTQQGCAFCERAKALLRTQILAAGRHIGGFEELRERDQTGGLAQWATRTA